MKKVFYSCVFLLNEGCTQNVTWELSQDFNAYKLANEWKNDLQAESFILNKLDK
jgi:hypothetical protein